MFPIFYFLFLNYYEKSDILHLKDQTRRCFLLPHIFDLRLELK